MKPSPRRAGSSSSNSFRGRGDGGGGLRRRRPAAEEGQQRLLLLLFLVGSIAWLLVQTIVFHGYQLQIQTDTLSTVEGFIRSSSSRRKRRIGIGIGIDSDSNTSSAGRGRIVHTCTCLDKSNDLRDNKTSTSEPLGLGLLWLHIPKTGTSFASTLWSYACTLRGTIDLRISNYVGGLNTNNAVGGFVFHDLYEQALAQRYPLEMYCHRDVIGSENIGHQPVTDIDVVDENVVGFFRQPEERLSSAFDHGLHSVGFKDKTDLYDRCRYAPSGPNFTCYATYPGIAGCQTRMLTGGMCASKSNPTPLPRSRVNRAVRNVQSMAFVGITELWGESICQFHRTFGGIPQQDEFGNVHPGKRRTRVEELPPGYREDDDAEVYDAAVKEFHRRMGPEPCYRAVRADTITRSATDSEESTSCIPRKCAGLSKQCGEWPDGCGGTTVCGICNPNRDGLPLFWRAQCIEGMCVPTCPGWARAGLWHTAINTNDSSGRSSLNRSAVDIVQDLRAKGAPVDAVEPLEILAKNLNHVTPLDAVRICAQSCHGPSFGRGTDDFTETYCACGTYPDDFLSISPTVEDYRNAHELIPSLDSSKVRVYKFTSENGQTTIESPIALKARLPGETTRPRCCSPLPDAPKVGRLPPNNEWESGTIQADFFETINLGCGGHDDCERHGHDRGASVVVYNHLARLCHLGQNEGYDVPMSDKTTRRAYLILVSD